MNTITAIVKRYYDQDTWKENLIFEKDSFELLQDILEDAGELTDRTAYENLVQTEYAQTKMPILWTNSYFVSTVGGAPLETVKQYIENQKTSQRQKDKMG